MFPELSEGQKQAIYEALQPIIASLKAGGEQGGRFDPRLLSYQMAAYAASQVLGLGEPNHPHEGQMVKWLYLFE